MRNDDGTIRASTKPILSIPESSRRQPPTLDGAKDALSPTAPVPGGAHPNPVSPVAAASVIGSSDREDEIARKRRASDLYNNNLRHSFLRQSGEWVDPTRRDSRISSFFRKASDTLGLRKLKEKLKRSF